MIIFAANLALWAPKFSTWIFRPHTNAHESHVDKLLAVRLRMAQDTDK
jgi:hypothetical protein